MYNSYYDIYSYRYVMKQLLWILEHKNGTVVKKVTIHTEISFKYLRFFFIHYYSTSGIYLSISVEHSVNHTN